MEVNEIIDSKSVRYALFHLYERVDRPVEVSIYAQAKVGRYL